MYGFVTFYSEGFVLFSTSVLVHTWKKQTNTMPSKKPTNQTNKKPHHMQTPKTPKNRIHFNFVLKKYVFLVMFRL